MHNAKEQGNGQPYMIQAADSSHLIANPHFEQVESMYSEGTPEFIVDQGVYYPAATNYGYYCTGLGAPTDWEDHHRIFGVDGPDVQFTGVQTESLPYVYYTPSYGYAESPYNPYNPYIPGAMIGVDNPFLGAQQYYTFPPYQNSIATSGYVPIIVQSDANSPESLLNAGSTNVGSEGRGSKSTFASPSAAFGRNSTRTSDHTNSMNRLSDATKDSGSGKPAAPYLGFSGGGIPGSTFSRAFQGSSPSSSIEPVGNNINRKVPSNYNQFKVDFPDYGPSSHGWVASEKSRPKFHLGRAQDNINVPTDSFGEQNRGPRTYKPKSQIAVKAYTTKAGAADAQGMIIIDTDQYNKDSFSLDYEDVKFFVIKSYSEDDVHKSIKYSVWSSTPHGNKKLQNAYEDAQRLSAGKHRGCPIFLFFSVNASGQFCGVAEMIGPVDFHKDMDFWQQDKWSGSFPVKWHFIKDVQNTSFRHIILENNENKPVTNSRDTQEIFFGQGMEMLKIFKNHTLKTSILDDFTYYENRQKMMQEERARLGVRTFQNPSSMLVDSRKLPNAINQSLIQEGIGDQKDPNSIRKNVMTVSELLQTNASEGGDSAASELKIGSLTINPNNGYESTEAGAFISMAKANAGQEIVTVGSMPVKVNGLNDTSSALTVGTIPLNPRSLQADKEGSASRSGASKLNNTSTG
ncbi:hypothetical protein SAY87_022359 [Trapa incisa]|uniref:YTH domain-containing family protein n=1 Tax=Trapa incisa TaxID=236973 RepID=A0AAN7Q4J4_9MYRT|nr:hypothetical protein SAY87_022359 [Trapa incisa]